MQSELTAAYLALQLDPNNDQQVAAFETLCWTHIFHHTSSHWVEQVQSRAFPLVREIKSAHPGKRKTLAFDHTLNRLTFEFMQKYARVIWPSTEADRAHLNAKGNGQTKLMATSGYIRAGSSTQTKLQRDLGKPCTEQMIVVESVIGRRVREFLKELVTTRVVLSLGEHSAEMLLYMVLGWAERLRWRLQRIWKFQSVWRFQSIRKLHRSAFLVLLQGSGPSRSVRTVGVPTLPTLSKPPHENDSSHLPPTSTWVPSQQSDTQADAVLSVPSSIVASHATGSIDNSNHYSADVLCLMNLDDEGGSKGNIRGSSSIDPNHWTDMQMESKVLAPSSIATPHEAGPIDDSNHYRADVLSLSDSDDEGDSNDRVSGLLCSHVGCQLRFPDWASFEAYARLPHNDSRGVSDGGEMSATNAATEHDNLHEAMDTSLVERNGNKARSTELQQGLLLEGYPSGGTIRWMNLAGERI